MADSIISDSFFEVPMCGTGRHKRPAKPGFKYCAQCLDYHVARRKRLKAQGICRRCPDAAKPGRTLCEKCRQKESEQRRQKIAAARAIGNCVGCGKRAPLTKRTRCFHCTKLRGKERDRAKARGICLQCRQRPAAPSRVTCLTCLDALRTARLERRARGLCTYKRCPEPAKPGKGRCVAHAAAEAAWSKASIRRNRERVIAAYGGGCACCGESQYEFLAVDHVYGGGCREGLAGDALVTRVIKEGFPARFQILCHNCNMAKGFYGRCPHQAAKEKAA